MDELDGLLHEICVMQVPGGSENTYGKVNILLQTYISRHNMDAFSLVSDQAYVAQVTNTQTAYSEMSCITDILRI